ncbi:hypothetical protein DY000_02009418 [Brassica cretica]|uniref:Uncharacterized protein n=1 Tax=Brassica cretica TaxID=69181 RepID=A0ABQ7BW25_BRACR|nr:hypothetical protein DY000_02009418 [Brassica cretica]
MGATLPERRHELAVPNLSERPYQSDLTRSLAISSFRSDLLERQREVAPAPERPHHSDTQRSLGFVSKMSRERPPGMTCRGEYHMEFLETFECIWSSKEVIKVIIGRAVHGSDLTGATPRSRCALPLRATLPERRHEVARPFFV